MKRITVLFYECAVVYPGFSGATLCFVGAASSSLGWVFALSSQGSGPGIG